MSNALRFRSVGFRGQITLIQLKRLVLTEKRRSQLHGHREETRLKSRVTVNKSAKTHSMIRNVFIYVIVVSN